MKRVIIVPGITLLLAGLLFFFATDGGAASQPASRPACSARAESNAGLGRWGAVLKISTPQITSLVMPAAMIFAEIFTLRRSP